MHPIFECVIPGRPMVKKNGQKVVTIRRGRRSFKTKVNTPQYQEWENEAAKTVRRARHQINGPINCHIHARFIFYFENRQAEADLSNLYEGIQDVLKTQGIIVDDILIESHDGSRKRFYQTPRLEVKLYEYQEPIDKKPTKPNSRRKMS